MRFKSDNRPKWEPDALYSFGHPIWFTSVHSSWIMFISRQLLDGVNNLTIVETLIVYVFLFPAFVCCCNVGLI